MNGVRTDTDALALGQPVSVSIRVPFNHCDPLFVVWHGRYFEYFEVARTALLATRKLDALQVRDMGYKMFVTEARCRYVLPLSYNDEIEVTAQFTALRPLIRIAYAITRTGSPRKCARAFTALATTDFEGRLLETPDDILARLLA